MEHRNKPFAISRPQPIESASKVNHPPLAPPTPTIAPNNITGLRPLSDIRELSEPSIADQGHQRAFNHPHPRLKTSTSNSLRRKPVHRSGSTRSHRSANQQSKHAQSSSQAHQRSKSTENGSSSYSSTPERSSFYSIPHSSVPYRTSSHDQQEARPHMRKPSIREAPPPAHPKFEGYFVPNHGHSRSPVKESSARHDAVKSDGSRRVPSRTYIRKPHPADILESPSYKHPRVKLELQVSAPLFVGGGSVEGQVKVTVDENERLKSRRSLGIGALAVDLVGFEDMSGGRKASFLAVGTELIDAAHPPPVDMIEPANPLTPDDPFWTLTASTSLLAFMVSLPLEPGPPPFQSKDASIRYLLCATALINDAGKLYRVRVSQEVHILPTYDPDKALTSLPSPLTATDELRLAHFGRSETVKLTAGVHRQVWVSGSSVFVDVHIANKSHKAVKRLELSLERNILCYKHAAASTREKSVSAARIFENNEQTMINRLVLKPGAQSWNGVGSYSSETRTYELELPRGHATVHCGKYFEVRFFLNVSVSVSNSKLVSVQLPMILIHINSLDVLPNSVDQVAAAIEEKKRAKHRPPRTRSRKHSHSRSRNRSASSPSETVQLSRKPSYGQGRAFSAPVEQAIDRQRMIKADIQHLAKRLDASPRKHAPQLQGVTIKKMGGSMSMGGVSVGSKTAIGNPFRDVGPKTPILAQENLQFERSRDEPSSGIRRKQSQASTRSKGSFFASRSERHQEDENKPKHNFTVVTNRIEPHTLGLTSLTNNKQNAFDGSADRPDTSMSTREKLDRSRFEFKGVRRKGTTGSLKEKGMHLWEQVKDRGGWI